MQYAYRNWYVPQTSVEIEGRLGVAQVIGHVSSYTEAVSSHIPSCPIYKAALKRKKNRTKENSVTSTYSDTDLKYCIYPVIISNKSFKTEQFHVLYWNFIFSLSPQSSEPVKELYTQLTEKLEAQKKSPPPLEETPSLDLGLHPVTVPTTASTPTTPLWGEKTRTFHQWLTDCKWSHQLTREFSKRLNILHYHLLNDFSWRFSFSTCFLLWQCSPAGEGKGGWGWGHHFSKLCALALLSKYTVFSYVIGLSVCSFWIVSVVQQTCK